MTCEIVNSPAAIRTRRWRADATLWMGYFDRVLRTDLLPDPLAPEAEEPQGFHCFANGR